MPQMTDPYEPTTDDGLAVPASWITAPVASTAVTAECGCPADCPRDHENE